VPSPGPCTTLARVEPTFFLATSLKNYLQLISLPLSEKRKNNPRIHHPRFFCLFVPLKYPFSFSPAMASALSGSALQASRAALSAALADHSVSTTVTDDASDQGEIQEVDMQAQAEGIRTIFNDPTNFNVKVRSEPSPSPAEP
jgi:hypothetical protein